MESREDIARFVSPELVLVDPELAARARAALPDHPWPAPVRIEAPPAPAPRAQAGVAATFWIFGLGLVLLVFGLTLISTNDRPTFAAEGEPNQASAPAAPQETEPRAAKPKATPKRVKRVPAPRARTTARARPKPQANPEPATTALPTPNRPPPARVPVGQGFRPARIFSWPPHASATSYQVVFLRNGRPFYRTRTGTARLQLPQRVRFTTGRYRWTVRPAIGDRLEGPIVDSTFQVSGD